MTQQSLRGVLTQTLPLILYLVVKVVVFFGHECGIFPPIIILLFPPLLMCFLQVLENNRNQLEAKGVQLAANKDQLQTISLKLEEQDSEMTSMREKIGALEKQLASSLKDMLLQENSPRQEVR